MADGTLYFAYGSNINLDQMAYRCPSAQVVAPVVLDNYKLHSSFCENGFCGDQPRSGLNCIS